MWVDAKINGRTAELVFDTGSGDFLITSNALAHFGLRTIKPSSNDSAAQFVIGETDECALRLGKREVKVHFRVLAIPDYVQPNFDGIIGWWPLRHNVLHLDWNKMRVSLSGHAPSQDQAWNRVKLVPDTGTLELAIPYADRTNGVLCVDTGSPCGLELSEFRWQEWRVAHPDAPATLATVFSPRGGFSVIEEAWADRISIGPITLYEVPILRSAATNEWGTQYEGTLGLAALKRLELIVDGKSGLAFLQSKKDRPSTYEHNRLGAVFVPAEGYTNRAVARVVQGSPAFEAGIRDGDILLQVDDVRVTSWSARWLEKFYKKPGTKLKLTLDRNGKEFTTSATLRQILSPETSRAR